MTISTYLLLLFALTQLVSLIMVIGVSGRIRQGFEDAYSGTPEDAETIGSVAAAFSVASVAVILVLALVLVTLAMFNNRGRNGTRITTWIVGGIMVCCVGGSVVSGAAGFSPGGSGGANAPSGAEIERSMSDALPSWYGPASTAVNIVGLLALITALILLALPKSNEFFRKPTAAWEPPTPGAGYPGQPQGTGQPGYPQSTGEPGYPSSGEPSYPPPATDRPDDTPPADRPGSTPPSTS
ncbi:hypothetical protein [Micromonospora sp. WMMD964]|uniref:hypothetical protein n=1 Tax=Micromonospora sp. WMMD964 TaxID=3016091 RepID=UPI00249B073D|nr:hypothetical protein [Micromonospora sp. WMMD964]WFF02277.1 hypothetical protein O7616_05800 [Micromonospora sp. WMMD964]